MTSRQSSLRLVHAIAIVTVALIGQARSQACSYVGVSDPKIVPDDSIKVSSSDPEHGIDQIRLNCCEGDYGNAWCPNIEDEAPWVEIRVDRLFYFGGLILQPPTVLSNTEDHFPERFMKTFELQVKNGDSPEFIAIPNVGAIDNRTVANATVRLGIPILTSTIRILPKMFEDRSCFRIELLECIPTSTVPSATTPTTTTTTSATTTPARTTPRSTDAPLTAPAGCSYVGVSDPLKVPDDNINVSSSAPLHGKDQIRLGCCEGSYGNAWCPSAEDPSSWVEIRIDRSFNFGGLIIQSPTLLPTEEHHRPEQFMKTFDLLIRRENSSSWLTLQNIRAIDNNTVANATITLGSPLLTNAIRILPKTFQLRPCFRLEILECLPPTTIPTTTTTTTTTTKATTATTTQRVTQKPILGLDWLFNNFTLDVLVSHNFTLNIVGKPTPSPLGIILETAEQFLQIINLNGTCLTNPSKCDEGLTIMLDIKITSLVEGSVIFTTGADKPDQPGVTLVYRYGLIHVVLSTLDKSWYLSVSRDILLTHGFNSIYVSWSLDTYLRLVINKVEVASSAVAINHTSTASTTNSLIIGGNTVKCIISNVKIWLVHILTLIHNNIVSCTCGNTTKPTTTKAPTTTPVWTTQRPTTSVVASTTRTTSLPPYSTTPQCNPGCRPEEECSAVPTDYWPTDFVPETTQPPKSSIEPSTRPPVIATDTSQATTKGPQPSTEIKPATQEPQPTTQGPQPTTQGPQPTTQRPQPTTQGPQPTTQGPQPTTQGPQPTTQGPQPTTQGPQPTTQGPQPTTQGPQPTTQGPQPTTQGPQPTTQGPQPTTQGPQSTTQGPQPTTQGPQPTTQGPQTTTQGPQPTTQGPQPTTQGPQPTTQGPQTTTQGPQPTTQGPQPTTQGPQPTTQGPQPTTQGPQTTTQGPQPTTQGPQPTTQGPLPTTQGPQPTTQGPQTTTQGPQPTTQGPQPTTQGPQLTTQGPQPTTQGPQPTTQGPQPTTQGPQPTTQGPQPTTQGPQPTTQGPQPTTQGPQPTTQGPQPTTQGPQPTTHGSQPTTQGPQPTTQGPQPTTQGPQPTTQGPQPTTQGPQPTTQGPQPTTQGPQPTTQGPQPTTQGPQPTTTAPATTPQPTSPTTTTPTTTTTTTTQSTSTRPPCPEWTFTVSLITSVDTNGRGQLTCSVASVPAAGLTIRFTWYVNGVSFQSALVTSPTTSVSILASLAQQSLLNKTVSCSAEVGYQNTFVTWCSKTDSNVIRPHVTCPPNTPIRLVEGQGLYVLHLNVSVPPALLCKPGDNSNCRVEVITEIRSTNNELRCSNTEYIPQTVIGAGIVGDGTDQRCGVVITNSNWLLGVTIPIKATIDGINDGDRTRVIEITVRIVGQATGETETVFCNSISVTAVNNDRPCTCSSVNDPHMTTFDKFRYNNMIAGEFVMYRHTTLPYEVRSLYRHCSALNTHVTCNCGASVRVGDDVIVFNTCDARQNLPPFNHVGSSVINVEIYKNGEFTPGTRIKRIGSGQKYEVYLPTGTKVTVSAAKKPFMDIHVTGSATDLSRSEGLCGNFDGNPGNDLQGVVADTFSRRWLRTSSIFNGVQANASYSVPQYCSCIAGQQAVCEAGLDVFKCSAESRNPADVTASLVRLAKTPIFGQQQARFRRAVENEQAPLVASGSKSFTETEARDFCDFALQNSTATMACIEHLSNVSVSESIKSCTDDLNITGDPEWALSHLNDITQECLSTARQNASAWESPEAQGGEPALSDDLRNNLCSKDCGANGDCVNADCVCKNGYTGEVCTVEPNALPVIATAYLACDILSSSCSSVTIVGLNFHASTDLTCHFEYVTVGATVIKTGVVVNAPAAYISMYQIECTQPNARGQSAIIRVSNDKTKLSNESYLHVIHKSSCQQCYFADGGNSASCTWRADTCVIDSQCYARYEIFADDSCYRCDPDKRTDSWTRLSEPRCLATAQPISGSATSSDSNDTVVIVLGVIVGVLCLAVLVIAIFLLKRRFNRKQSYLERFDDDLQVDLSRSRAAQTSSGLDLHSRTEADKQEAIYNPTFN